MARYSALLGKRVEVQYRAGDIHLPATATLVGDSGRSIFLEERILQAATPKTFRWEIPYHSIVRIAECLIQPQPVQESAPGAAQKSPAEAAPNSLPLLRLNDHPGKA